LATPTIELPQTRGSNKPLLYAALVVIFGVLATTLSQFQVLGLIPLKNLLKNELHADRAGTAAFLFWIGLAWYFKPLAGVITDAFPLFGTRRKSYMLLGAIFAVVFWIVMYFTPHQYGKLLWVAIAINLFTVITSTVVGGYMVETAQQFSAPGRLTSVRNFVEQFCLLISGPAGGLLGAVAFGWTAIAGASLMFLLVLLRRKFSRTPASSSST
jgi:Na+/melibiose symporter-like transporter